MGTRKKELLFVLDKMRWGIPKLAEAIYDEIDEDIVGNEDRKAEIARIADRIKKQLKRPTTKDEVFDNYLKVLVEQPRYSDLKLDLVKPSYSSHNCLSDEFSEVMKGISLALDGD